MQIYLLHQSLLPAAAASLNLAAVGLVSFRCVVAGRSLLLASWFLLSDSPPSILFCRGI